MSLILLFWGMGPLSFPLGLLPCFAIIFMRKDFPLSVFWIPLKITDRVLVLPGGREHRGSCAAGLWARDLFTCTVRQGLGTLQLPCVENSTTWSSIFVPQFPQLHFPWQEKGQLHCTKPIMSQPACTFTPGYLNSGLLYDALLSSNLPKDASPERINSSMQPALGHFFKAVVLFTKIRSSRSCDAGPLVFYCVFLLLPYFYLCTRDKETLLVLSLWAVVRLRLLQIVIKESLSVTENSRCFLVLMMKINVYERVRDNRIKSHKWVLMVRMSIWEKEK